MRIKTKRYPSLARLVERLACFVLGHPWVNHYDETELRQIAQWRKCACCGKVEHLMRSYSGRYWH